MGWISSSLQCGVRLCPGHIWGCCGRLTACECFDAGGDHTGAPGARRGQLQHNNTYLQYCQSPKQRRGLQQHQVMFVANRKLSRQDDLKSRQIQRKKSLNEYLLGPGIYLVEKPPNRAESSRAALSRYQWKSGISLQHTNWLPRQQRAVRKPGRDMCFSRKIISLNVSSPQLYRPIKVR